MAKKKPTRTPEQRLQDLYRFRDTKVAEAKAKIEAGEADDAFRDEFAQTIEVLKAKKAEILADIAAEQSSGRRAPRGRLAVTLEAVPDPDFPEGSHEATVRVFEHLEPVDSIEDAQRMVEWFIAKHDLGGGNFPASAGIVVDDQGKEVARIAYNLCAGKPGRGARAGRGRGGWNVDLGTRGGPDGETCYWYNPATGSIEVRRSGVAGAYIFPVNFVAAVRAFPAEFKLTAAGEDMIAGDNWQGG